MMTSANSTDAARNKVVVSTFYEQVYNNHDLAFLEDLLAEDHVEHSPEIGNGREAFATFLAKIFGVFPEISFSLSRLIAEGDLVVAHALMRKMPADRGTVVAEFFRLADGKVVEHWDVTSPVAETTKNGNEMV